ncbi:MAG: type II toxin-antitoxin system HipA family toxin [Steroidobacteraceae bacterium]
MRSLVAWVDGRRAGELTEQHLPSGSLFSFEYGPEAAPRDLVSLTMLPSPSGRRFETSIFPPPFEMILPEGERRMRIEAARKIIRSDDFSLLSYVGANPVNRVRFLTPEAGPEARVPEIPTPREIGDCTSGRALFTQLMQDLDLRQGIAGIQPKILGAPPVPKVSLDLRQYRGSTHILKSSTAAYPFLAANEYVCLRAFESAGLAVPAVTLSVDGELLLVERFDRLPGGNHLGFEEAAALMGESSASKYQRDYGSLLEALSQFVSPAAEAALRRDLTKALVLNWLLGNGDAHLKNFGLLYRDDADVRLAPFYDCVSTLPYLPNDVPALALSLDWYSKAWWPRAKLEEFGMTYGKLTSAEMATVIEESRAGVAGGVSLIRRLGRRIRGITDLSRRMAMLWTERMRAFS